MSARTVATRCVAAVGVVACSIPAKHLVSGDARVDDADARGQLVCPTRPKTAPASVTIAGTLRDGTFATLPNVNVSFTTSAGVSFTVSTSATGAYSLVLDTNNMPLAGFFTSGPPPGMETLLTHTFLPVPLTADGAKDLFAFTSADLNRIAGGVMVTPASNLAHLNVVALDCAGNSMAGVAITTTPAGTVHYLDTANTFDPSLNATSSSGAAWIFNLDLTAISIDGTAPNATFHQMIDLSTAQGSGSVNIVPMEPPAMP